MGTDEVTGAVTPPEGDEPWRKVGMTKEEWDLLEIPGFLRRQAPMPPAPAPTASPSGGETSGEPSNSATVTPTSLTNFDQFKVDPNEIESRIRQEADRRWRNWTPSKEQPKRPRLSTFERQVRKEFYP